MKTTHILVDFENVQPSAADIALVRGERLRLWIFRGPGQKKYSAEVAEAWQPLGDRLRFVHCSKAGRNALDMHIAFELGRLLASGNAARCVVVSKDTDYDPLLHTLRAQGADAMRATHLKAALVEGDDKPAKKKPAAPAKKAAAVPKAALPKKGKPRTSKAVEAESAAAPPRKASKAGRATAGIGAAGTPAPELLEKAIKHLLEHPKSRPAKRKALEKNLESVLRKKIDVQAVPALVDALERRGVIRIDGNKITYPQWGEPRA
jgi:hypothetical protein